MSNYENQEYLFWEDSTYSTQKGVGENVQKALYWNCSHKTSRVYCRVEATQEDRNQ